MAHLVESESFLLPTHSNVEKAGSYVHSELDRRLTSSHAWYWFIALFYDGFIVFPYYQMNMSLKVSLIDFNQRVIFWNRLILGKANLWIAHIHWLDCKT